MIDIQQLAEHMSNALFLLCLYFCPTTCHPLVLSRGRVIWLHHRKRPSIRGGNQGVLQTDCLCAGLRAQSGIRTQGPQTGKSPVCVCLCNLCMHVLAFVHITHVHVLCVYMQPLLHAFIRVSMWPLLCQVCSNGVCLSVGLSGEPVDRWEPKPQAYRFWPLC